MVHKNNGSHQNVNNLREVNREPHPWHMFPGEHDTPGMHPGKY